MELVTPMMKMILITLTLMEMMTVMEMMVETEEMVEVTVRVTTMLHYLLRRGHWRSTMICMVMPTTIQSFSPFYTATTPGAPCSTGRSIGPTLTTPASMRRRCTSVKGVGCATSTVLS